MQNRGGSSFPLISADPRSIVLTEIYPKNAKRFIQIAGHKTFNTMQHIVISRGNHHLPSIWKQEYCIAEEAVLWFANFIFHPIGFGWSVTEVKGRLFKKAVSMQHCFGHTTNLYFLLNIERLRKLWYITWEKFHNGDFIFCQPGDTLQNGKVYHSSL